MLRCLFLLLSVLLLSGCFQSRIVECPFEQVVDHLETRYGTQLRIPEMCKLVRYSKENPFEYSLEEKREMFDEHMADPENQAALDKHFKELGISEEQYFETVVQLAQMVESWGAVKCSVVEYRKGEFLRLELRSRFIVSFRSYIVIESIDEIFSRISVDQFSAFAICCSSHRSDERKFLDEFEKELQAGVFKQRYKKPRPMVGLPDWLFGETENAQPSE